MHVIAFFTGISVYLMFLLMSFRECYSMRCVGMLCDRIHNLQADPTDVVKFQYSFSCVAVFRVPYR